LKRRGFELAKCFEELRKDASDFYDSQDSELVGVDDCFDTRFAHQWAGGSEQFELGVFAQGFYERGRVSIA